MDCRHSSVICTVLLMAVGCQGLAGIEYRTQARLEPVCSAAVARCDGNLRRVCADDGMRWEDAPCEPTRPYCTGAGECVCIDDADDDVCTRDHCENGDLVVEPVLSDFPCDLWKGTPGDTSCARDGEGRVRCWGSNGNGELGLGYHDDNPHRTPISVPIPPVRGLALGAAYACALLRDGTVDCWGKNDHGQARGAWGDDVLEPAPIALPGLARRVATGANHACAVLEDTTVQCWGINSAGQLGDGTLEDRPIPAPVLSEPSTPLVGVTELALGSSSSCALLEGGDVWCWGDDLVIGDDVSSETGTRVLPVYVLGGVTEVSAGTDHTCALVDGGEVWCWGLSRNGETGDPAPTAGKNHDVTATPFDVAAAMGSIHVSAGYRHTCATHSSGVWCWGGDFWGQLGDGGDCASGMCDQDFHRLPQPVKGLGAVDHIGTGFLHTCVIAHSGGLSCWGPNKHGQLGDGTDEGADAPTPVVW